MAANEKKGITVKIDAELHSEVRKYVESNEMTMADFVTLALQDELHTKMNMEVKNMGNMRTLAFQVPEELFHKIKDYLQRNNMTQKEFVIGLIETEIERDLTQRAAESKQQEITAVSEFEGSSEQFEDNNTEKQSESNFEDISGNESEEAEDLNENEYQGMSMGM